jgi:hypothetical protein
MLERVFITISAAPAANDGLDRQRYRKNLRLNDGDDFLRRA